MEGGDGALGTKVLDALGECGRGVDVLENSEVKGKTDDVRSSHRSTGNAVGSSRGADPGGQNLIARGADVDGLAPVGTLLAVPLPGGEVGADGTNGQGVGRTGGRRG